MPYMRSKNGAGKRRGTTSRSRKAALRKSSDAVNKTNREPDDFFTPSTGNVFEDVGFPPAEARNLLLRSELMVTVKQMIQRRRLTQAQAAKLFGVTQPRISDLMRGKIERFSIDMLISMLTRAGAKVDIVVQSKAA